MARQAKERATPRAPAERPGKTPSSVCAELEAGGAQRLFPRHPRLQLGCMGLHDTASMSTENRRAVWGCDVLPLRWCARLVVERGDAFFLYIHHREYKGWEVVN